MGQTRGAEGTSCPFLHQNILSSFQDLRFENPFGSNDEADSAQIPSPLTADVPGSQTPTSVVPSGTPPVPLPPFSNNYDTYVDDEGNYNYEDDDDYDDDDDDDDIDHDNDDDNDDVDGENDDDDDDEHCILKHVDALLFLSFCFT